MAASWARPSGSPVVLSIAARRMLLLRVILLQTPDNIKVLNMNQSQVSGGQTNTIPAHFLIRPVDLQMGIIKRIQDESRFGPPPGRGGFGGGPAYGGGGGYDRGGGGYGGDRYGGGGGGYGGDRYNGGGGGGGYDRDYRHGGGGGGYRGTRLRPTSHIC